MGLSFNSLFNGKKLSVLLVLFSFLIMYQLIGIYNVNSYLYKVDMWNDQTGNPANVTTPSFLSLQSCSIMLHSYATFIDSGSYSSTITYFSPNDVIIGSGDVDLSSNRTCIDLSGSSTSETLNDYYESKSSLSHSATTGTNYLKSTFNCDISGDWVNFTSNNTKRDSRNNVPYAYYKIVSPIETNTEMSGYLNATNFGQCLDVQVSPFETDTMPPIATWSISFYYVFNSSGSGIFNYDLDASNIITGTPPWLEYPTVPYISDWYYYKKSDSSTLTFICAESCNGLLALERDTEYVLMLYKTISSQVSSNPILNAPESNFDINIYTPDWDCSDYGECSNGTKSRTCIDPSSKVPDKIEYLACYTGALESFYLGFENTTTQDIWYNYFGWLCSCTGDIKSVMYPEGWVVDNPNYKVINLDNKVGKRYDFVKMTNEISAYEGDKVLKMWVINPQLRIPDFTGFVGVEETEITAYISSTNYTNNNGWVNPDYAFSDNSLFTEGTGTDNITYNGFNINASISPTATILRNLTIRLDANRDTAPATIVVDCIQIALNETWSTCQNISVLELAETTYLFDFTDFAIGLALGRDYADTLKVFINGSGGSGTIEMDWVAVQLEYYDPEILRLVYDDLICGNQTTNIFPDVYNMVTTDENDSIFVERNVTLPTPFMSTSFKVKKCTEPELKFYATPICFDFVDHCYNLNEDCEESPKGSITFYILDADTGELIIDIRSDVIHPNAWEIREYAIDSLQPNKEYTIGLAVIPENTVDPTSLCVYVDDVRIDIREQALVCESECIGTTEIQRVCKQYDVSGNCQLCEQIELITSTNCVDKQTVIDKIESCSDWCGCEEFDEDHANYYTKYVGNIVEGCNITQEGTELCCEYQLFDDSGFCQEECIIPETTDTLFPDVQEVLEDRGLGFLGNFFTATFIVLMILLLIAFGLTYKLDKSWQIFAIVMIIELLIVSVLWVQFAFIGIIIVVVLAFFVAKTYNSTAKGG